MINLKEILKYFNKMKSEGKKITQQHINRFLDAQDRDGFDTKRYRQGGECKICGKPFKLSILKNIIADYQWYLPICVCEEKARNETYTS